MSEARRCSGLSGEACEPRLRAQNLRTHTVDSPSVSSQNSRDGG